MKIQKALLLCIATIAISTFGIESYADYIVGSQITLDDIKQCSEIEFDLPNCKPELCFVDTKFGKVYRKLLGFSSKKYMCGYMERSENIGGVNCVFNTDDLTHISEVFKIYYNNDTVTQDITSVYKKYCKNVQYNELITPEDQSQVNHASFLIDKEFEAFYIPHDVNNSLTQDKNQSGDNNKDQSSNIVKKSEPIVQSVAFRADEVAKIHDAIKIYESMNANINGDQSKNNEAQKIRNISYYLNSILYIDDDKWSIWLNDNKLRQDNNDIKVLNVNKESATFQVMAVDMPKLEQIIFQNELQTKPDNFVKADKIAENVYNITFTLGINQKLLLNDLLIVDGK